MARGLPEAQRDNRGPLRRGRAQAQDTAQMEKFAAARPAAEAHRPAGAPRTEEQSTGGSLASDAQLAALRESSRKRLIGA